MDETLNLHSLSRDDLIEELKLQIEKNREYKLSAENDTQRIYELTRQLEAANATQAYLMQEIEQLNTTAPNDEVTNTQMKLKNDYDELRKNYNAINICYETLQQDFEKQQAEYVELKRKFELKNSTTDHTINLENMVDDYQKRIGLLENENMELLQKLEEVQCNELQQTLAMATQEKKIEVLQDQVNCLEENLKCKRAEIEEKLQILESVQEQLLEANAKIAQLTTAPQSNDQKGNSLFAEVDDQRQAMKQLLSAQKKNYLQMKKAYAECEHEIRRLKRENIAMHTELQTCSKIFYSADKTYQDKLKERIQYLLNQNESLEKQLYLTQERLKNVAGDNSVSWLESMLNFCRQETDDLKKQLHALRIQRASLEQQLRNTTQDMARWRFETLKARCLLLDRENILDEHRVAYNPCKDNAFHVTDEHIELLRNQTKNMHSYEIQEHSTSYEKSAPILPIAKQMEAKAKLPISTSFVKIDPMEYEKSEELLTGGSKVEQAVQNNDKLEIKKEMDVTAEESEKVKEIIEIENGIEMSVAHSEDSEKVNVEENKENLEVDKKIELKEMKNVDILRDIEAKNCENLKCSIVKSDETCRPSILTKVQSLVERTNNKHVKFTDAAPSIYKFNTSSNDDSIASIPPASDNVSRKQSSKSQIVVRRVIIKSKKENQAPAAAI